MWRGVLHHVRGQHQWILLDGSVIKCQHSEEFKEKKEHLLKVDSEAFKALQKIVLDRRFMKGARHFVRFRYFSTAFIPCLVILETECKKFMSLL